MIVVRVEQYLIYSYKNVKNVFIPNKNFVLNVTNLLPFSQKINILFKINTIKA